MFRPILLVSLVAATLFAFTGIIGESEATMPGANGKIAFVAERDGNREIYVMNADGTGQTRLTNTSAEEGGPAWSPDGTKIVFHSSRDGDSEIFVMGADGSGQTQLTFNGSQDFSGSWSPDGSKIAFSSDRDGNGEIYVMNADGSAQTKCTNDPSRAGGPSWSPDGTKIMFGTNRDAPTPDGWYNEVYVISSDCTGLPTNLSNSLSTYDSSGDWAPDGAKIVYSKELTSPGGNWEVFIMNPDGSGKTNVTNHAAIDSRGRWSPDGTKIVFDSNRDDPKHEIYVMNDDGSGVTRLTNNTTNDWQPAWGPKKIACIAGDPGCPVGGTVELLSGGEASPLAADAPGGWLRSYAAVGTGIALLLVLTGGWYIRARRPRNTNG